MQKRLNIHDAKTNLSAYLKDLKPGDKIILCRRNIAIAEITPLVPAASQATGMQKRPFGLAKGKFEIPAGFFEDLPEDVLKDFAS
jgi:antitoxin (DNA-binding transcriptional repressor) of toxin-antitoxin stability system